MLAGSAGRFMIPALVALCGALAGTAQLLARQAPQDDPVRTAVDLVRLDFLALAPDGQPVTDLAAADVTLKVDGRARAIRLFQFISLADPRPAAHSRESGKALPPPFGTNVLGDAGRTILIIVETDSIRANVAQQATGAAAAFVAGLSPLDWVGLVTMPYGGILVEPTRDHERVMKVLPTITGQASQQTNDSDKGCRTRNTLNALADHFAGLAHIEGPKTVIFVSSGMMLPRRDAPMTGPPGPCELRSVHYDEVGQAASLARANVYVVKPDDFVIDSARNAFVDPTASRFRSSDEELAGIESLAGVTSGVLLRLTPSDRSAFARIARESAGYYLVGFEPRPNERNGSSHRVELNLARPGARVKALPNVTIAKADGRKPALTPQAMLRDGRSYSDLPLRVVGLASPNPGDNKLTVVALVEPIDRSVTLESAAFGLIDQRGRLVAQWTANARELASLPATSAGLASPGRYRLRVAAIDGTGRRGSADYEISAELVTADGLTLSTMVLGVSYERNFVPKLQYVSEPTANGYFEIFGQPPPGTLSVAMELAATEDGPALVRVPGTIVSTKDPDRRRATGVVPIGQLATGDYVLRAVLSVDGRPIATLRRILRKAASRP
jgi:VWFA-related protein